MQDYLCGLTAAQLQAVTTADGPVLILAGAGSGKTRTLVCRLAYLCAGAGIDPGRLLAITFTAKAAEEMRSRLCALDLPGIALQRMRVCTIHALCLEILKTHGTSIGISPDVRLITPADRTVLLKQAAAAVRDGARSIKKLELEITREKNAGTGYAGLSPVGRAYQRELEARGMLDFDDLLLKSLALFDASPGALADVRSRFSHISIDEFQDVNAGQYAFIQAICAPQTSLCAVGDPDQAIYGFRGAQADIFLRFQADFPAAALVRLEENYRSSATILAAAQAVIARNTRRIEKQLTAHRPAAAPVELWNFATDRQEAAFVSGEIERLLGGMRFENLGCCSDDCVKSFGDIAVVYRLHQQGRLLKKALQSRGMPVDMAATRPVFDEPAVKTVLALLELIADPAAGTAVAELLADSPFAVTPKVFERLQPEADTPRGLAELAETVPDLPAAARKSLQLLAETVGRFSALAGEVYLDRLIAQLWDGVFGAGQEKTDAYFAFSTAAMAFSGMPAAQGIPLFLEKIALLQEGEICSPQREAVTLMTLHSAKGLEFPVVFITGLEQGLCPLQAESDCRQPPDIEEERRLLYVGMTRARDRLYILNSRSRFVFGEQRQMPPSCFLADIPAVHCRSSLQKAAQKPGQKQLKLFA